MFKKIVTASMIVMSVSSAMESEKSTPYLISSSTTVQEFEMITKNLKTLQTYFIEQEVLLSKKCLISPNFYENITGLSLNNFEGAETELKKFSTLQSLDLSGLSAITSPKIAVLHDLPNLTELNISTQHVTGSCAKELQNLTRLTKLNMSYCSFKYPSNVMQFRGLTYLKDLNLTDIKIGVKSPGKKK